MKHIDSTLILEDYIYGKQTVEQLSIKYKISKNTIRRKLNKVQVPLIISSQKDVVVLMDTSYWGRNFGVCVLKDAYSGFVLWRKYIKHETLAIYQEGVDWLEDNGFYIEGIVCDGMRGIFKQFSRYRVQMCQFHQVAIIRRYLTNKPILKASIELKSIVKTLTKTDKESFIGEFNEWCLRWDNFLKERHIDSITGKSRYTHRRVRSACLSLKHNMPYLWTWYDNIDIGIPNTNNAIEGMFSDLKNKLRNHNGISKKT